MAGIGFELRRLVETRTIKGFVAAAFSGVVIVAGPWLISVLSVAAAQSLPFFSAPGVGLAFTGSMVWALAASLCISTGPLYLFVRFSADLIFEGRKGEAATLLLKVSAASAAASLPIGTILAFVLIGDAPHPFLFRASFAGFIVAADVLWAAMMTVTAIRKHGYIVAAYVIGMGAMYLIASAVGPDFGAAGALAALAAGYALIALLLIAASVRDLGLAPCPRAWRRLLEYAGRYRNLALAGTAYALGTWADKVALWILRGSAAPGTGFAVYPPYDNAFYLANLALIPGLVYFTLGTETTFNLDLRRFLTFLARRRQPEVAEARRRLGRNAATILVGQSLFQGTIVAALALLAPYLTRLLEFDPTTFVYLLWATFFQLVFLAALNMLFYLELYKNAAATTLAFLAVNAGLTAAGGLAPGPLPLGLPFLAACAVATALALALLFRGIGRFDRVVFLRAAGHRYGI